MAAPDSVEAILDALREPTWTARVEALRAAAATLGAAKLDAGAEQQLIGPLVDAAADPKWEVRKEAAVALAELRHHESAVHAKLEELEHDSNRWVSQAAERAVKRMRSRTSRAKEWELTPDAQDPTLLYIMARIREIGLRSMTPARIHDIAIELSEQLFRELAVETAHELRTLLTPIEGYLRKLQKHFSRRGADATAERFFTAAFERLRQARLLTDNMHTYGEVISADFAPVDVAGVIGEALSIGHDRGEGDGITRNIDVPGGLIIDALRERLVRAVANLVANACQAMPGGGTLTVRARRVDDTLEIVIGDTGRGMTPELLDQVRSRFLTTRKDEGGTGLGLPIAERIVEHDHRGRLTIESTAGAGTTVTLTLPVRRPIDE